MPELGKNIKVTRTTEESEYTGPPLIDPKYSFEYIP